MSQTGSGGPPGPSVSRLEHQFLSGAAATELVVPRYGEGTLAEVLPSICASQGLDRYENRLGLPEYPRWVVLLVDGLGWHNLLSEPEAAPYLTSLAAGQRPLTATVPSTTATSLTSLGTGAGPGEHGMVGYSFRLPGAKGAVLNPLTWRLPHSPRMVQPLPTVFETIAGEVRTVTVSLERFADSGLTEAALRGPEFQGLRHEGDEDLRRDLVVAAAASAPRTLVYAYERRLDLYGHVEGWTTTVWRDQLRAVDRACRDLRAALPDDTVLVVTADHGMVDVPGSSVVVIEDEPALAAGIDCVAGEGRFRQLYTDRESPDALARRWQAVLGDRAWVRTKDEAIDAGWFGTVGNAARARLGDVLVAARGDVGVMTRTLSQELALVGMHGSLTAAEMQVPFLVAAAD